METRRKTWRRHGGGMKETWRRHERRMENGRWDDSAYP